MRIVEGAGVHRDFGNTENRRGSEHFGELPAKVTVHDVQKNSKNACGKSFARRIVDKYKTGKTSFIIFSTNVVGAERAEGTINCLKSGIVFFFDIDGVFHAVH